MMSPEMFKFELRLINPRNGDGRRRRVTRVTPDESFDEDAE